MKKFTLKPEDIQCLKCIRAQARGDSGQIVNWVNLNTLINRMSRHIKYQNDQLAKAEREKHADNVQ